MAVATVARHQVIDCEGKLYRLVELFPSGDWELKCMTSGELSRMPSTQLLAQYRLGKVRFRVAANETRNVSQECQEAAVRPLRLTRRKNKAHVDTKSEEIRAKEKLKKARQDTKLVRLAFDYPWGSPIQEVVIRQAWPDIYGRPAPEKIPAVTTLWRWHEKLLKNGGDVRALLPRHDLKGQKKQEPNPEVQGIIEDVVDEKYLTPERNSIAHVYAEVIPRINAENQNRPDGAKLAIPPLQRLKDYIYSLDEFDKYAARYSLQSAQRKFRAVLKHVFAERPLERVELDATKLNFVVLDDLGMPIGRPWLHVCMDVRTRNVLGYYISFEPPSLATLFECLKRAILPKDSEFYKTLGVVGIYPCYGVFDTLVMDNAFENHSDALEPLSDVTGTVIQFCPRRKPWYKGKIERFIRSFSDLCRIVPGTTFANFFEKGDYDPVAEAVICWRDLERIIAIWIMDEYHTRPHRTLQCSPASAWRALTKPDQILLPCSAQEIEQLCRVPEIRRISHIGVEKLDIHWNSDEVTRMRYECGAEFDARVYFDHMNLGTIGITHPKTGEIVEVKAVCFDYANNLTLYQHKVTREFARAQQLEDNPLGWMEAQHRLLDIVDKARGVDGYCLPARASRFLLGNGNRIFEPTGSRDDTATTPKDETVCETCPPSAQPAEDPEVDIAFSDTDDDDDVTITRTAIPHR